MENTSYMFLNRYFLVGARLMFALTLMLAPLRLRLNIWTRPFFPVYSDYTDFLLSVSDFTLFLTIAFWACSLVLEPRRVRAGSPLVFILLAGLTVSAWISLLGSVDAIQTRYQAVRFTFLLLYYLFIVSEITSAGWVVLPAALMALIQTPVAVGQSFAQSSLGYQILGEHVLDPLVKGTSIIPVNGERFLRAYGFADHPNILGGCLAFAFVLLWTVVLHGDKRKPIISASVFLFIFPALLVTFSRSAWLSLSIGAAFLTGFALIARRWDAFARAALLGAACFAVSIPVLVKDSSVFEKRINNGNVSEDGPMFERAYLMRSGNTLFVEHSFVGVGLGVSPLAMKLRFEDFPVSYQPPHFVPLTAALETGVIGGMFYLLLFLAPGVDFLFRWRDHLQNPLAMGVFSLLFAISTVNLFDYYTWSYSPGRLWQWLAWGLYSVVSRKAG